MVWYLRVSMIDTRSSLLPTARWLPSGEYTMLMFSPLVAMTRMGFCGDLVSQIRTERSALALARQLGFVGSKHS